MEANELALRYLLDVIPTFGPCITRYPRGVHVPARLYRLAWGQAASHPNLFYWLLQVGSCTLPQTRHTHQWASKTIAKGGWFQICAYSYLQTLRLRVFYDLRGILQTLSRSRLQDNSRVPQRKLRFGLARGSILDGEAIF